MPLRRFQHLFELAYTSLCGCHGVLEADQVPTERTSHDQEIRSRRDRYRFGRFDRSRADLNELPVRVLNAPFATRRYFFGASENAVSITSPIGCQVLPSN